MYLLHKFGIQLLRPASWCVVGFERLDRDSAKLVGRQERVQDSVIALMDKKERVEATRHASLIDCLEDINRALGAIFRRLTSIEGTLGPVVYIFLRGEVLDSFHCMITTQNDRYRQLANVQSR